jgi:hypothetical protein
MAYISLKNVSKIYDGEVQTKALDNINFEIEKGNVTVILGPSGAGKTTLLNILGGMDSASFGQIIIDSKDISKLNKKELTLYRRNDVGFVFQFYNLMPNLTAIENIELAVEVCKNAFKPIDVLTDVGLQDKAKSFPAKMSGGEQQRVSIARAVAKNPKLLLCDEPTGALDSKTGKSIIKLLKDIALKHQTNVIIVTHNQSLKDIADQVIYIKNGMVEKIENNENPLSVDEIEW